MSARLHAQSKPSRQPGATGCCRPYSRWVCSQLVGALIFALATVGVSDVAHAQAEERQSLALERFSLPLDDSGFATTKGGSIVDHLEIGVGGLGHYQFNPLTIRRRSGARVEAIVQHRLTVDTIFTVGLFDLVELGFGIPLMPFQAAGQNLANFADDIGITSTVAHIGVGDFRFVPKFRLLREDRHGLNLSVLSTFSLPTSLSASLNPFSFEYGGGYLGEGPLVVTAAPEIVASKNFFGVRIAGNLGVKLRPPAAFGLAGVESEVLYRGGVGYDLGSWLPPPDVLWGKSGGTQRPFLVFVEVFGATHDRNPFGALDVLQPTTDRAEQLRRDRARAIHNALEGGMGFRWSPLRAWSVEAGATTAIIGGFGVPDVRVYAGIRYKFERLDDDNDGIEDDVDACPNDPEDKDNFEDSDGCPDTDDDKDGIPDALDACRLEVEDVDGFEDADGCPDVDNDGDGILDDADACPDRSGLVELKGCPAPKMPDVVVATPSSDAPLENDNPPPLPKKDSDKDGVEDDLDLCPLVFGQGSRAGCPADDDDGDGIKNAKDRCPLEVGLPSLAGCADDDKDGVANDRDKCPTEAETVNGIDDDDGCPDKGKSLVVVRGDKIDLGETVYFDSAKSTIQRRSFGLLDQIAQVLVAHPEIKLLEIAGHTDSAGSDAVNQELSAARAIAVRDALVTRGVPSARFVAKGYGESKPIADNATPAGRAKNRRVELVILER